MRLTTGPNIPVILTNVIATGGPSGFAEEHWQAVCQLARDRGCALYSATLDCAPDEQVRRMALPSRRAHRKLLNPNIMPELRRTRSLFDDGADYKTDLTIAVAILTRQQWRLHRGFALLCPYEGR